jgi:hypothetical protein
MRCIFPSRSRLVVLLLSLIVLVLPSVAST